jgi:hypothetical protein
VVGVPPTTPPTSSVVGVLTDHFLYAKNGIPGKAYFFIPSSLISTPIPAFQTR